MLKIIDIFNSLLDTQGFQQRWYCGSAWTLPLGWTHIISDVLIFISYVSIPICILLFSTKQNRTQYKYIFILFTTFIFFCGTVHLVDATIFWYPWYKFLALLKIITATVSMITAFILIKHIPKILDISSALKLKSMLSELAEQKNIPSLFENTPTPFIIINRDGLIKTCNKSLCEYSQFSIDYLTNKFCWELFPEKLHYDLSQMIKSVIATGTAITKAFILKNKEQVECQVEIHLILLNDQQQEVLITIKDLEQQKQLETTTKKLNAIFNNAVDGMIIINNKGIVQSFNKSAERIFQYSANEVIGKNIKMLMPTTYSKDHDSYISNYINTGHAKIIGTQRNVEGRTKYGEIVPLELSITSIVVDGEHIFTGTLRDITERVKMERKIQRAYEELESFAYIAAHDLREPLRGISNYSAFLIEDYSEKLDGEGKEKLKTLQKLSQRLEGFIESLLHFSRLDVENNTYAQVNLANLISEVLSSIDISIKSNNVKINIDKDMPTIPCNSIKIQEVYHNLIVNSIKYNNKENKVIDIGYYKDDQQPTIPYVFFVRDNGIGIKQSHHDVIFKMFKRLHSRDNFGGGSGAGLAFVKKIIDQHGGHIWLESELDKGTTFYFTVGKYESNA